MRKLKSSNVCTVRTPTNVELYNKITAVKKKYFPVDKINSTGELKAKISEYLTEPEDDDEAFIPHYEVIDDNMENLRFTILFTTKKNISKLKEATLFQADATYRLNWMNYPVYVIGKYTSSLILLHFKHLIDHIQCPFMVF